MDTSSVLEQYKTLVGQAIVKSYISEAVTFDSIHKYESRFLIEQGPTYNGCRTAEEFKAKLESLSVWLSYKLKQECLVLQQGVNPSKLLHELHSLKKHFFLNEGKIWHRGFTRIAHNQTKYDADTLGEFTDVNNVDEDYSAYVHIAHSDLSQLLSIVDVEEKFNSLFIGNDDTIHRNKHLVMKILQERRLINTYGKSTVPDRSKINLWAVMKVLQDLDIIKDSISDEEYMAIVWKYIQGEGAAPTRISASSVSKFNGIKNRLKSIYFKNA